MVWDTGAWFLDELHYFLYHSVPNFQVLAVPLKVQPFRTSQMVYILCFVLSPLSSLGFSELEQLIFYPEIHCNVDKLPTFPEDKQCARRGSMVSISFLHKHLLGPEKPIFCRFSNVHVLLLGSNRIKDLILEMYFFFPCKLVAWEDCAFYTWLLVLNVYVFSWANSFMLSLRFLHAFFMLSHQIWSLSPPTKVPNKPYTSENKTQRG